MLVNICSKSSDSQLWKAINHAWPKVKANVVWTMGNGKKIRFWINNWIALVTRILCNSVTIIASPLICPRLRKNSRMGKVTRTPPYLMILSLSIHVLKSKLSLLLVERLMRTPFGGPLRVLCNLLSKVLMIVLLGIMVLLVRGTSVSIGLPITVSLFLISIFMCFISLKES